jgi:hypothetical protein
MDDYTATPEEAQTETDWPDRWIAWLQYRTPQLAKCRVIEVEVVEEEVA